MTGLERKVILAERLISVLEAPYATTRLTTVSRDAITYRPYNLLYDLAPFHLMAGVDLRTVQERAGWRSLAMVHK